MVAVACRERWILQQVIVSVHFAGVFVYVLKGCLAIVGEHFAGVFVYVLKGCLASRIQGTGLACGVHECALNP